MNTDYKKGFFDMQKANGQQAERIKELEAERDAERDNCVAIIAAYQEQLAALRQRIADAPVVAWCVAYDTIHGTRIHSDPSMYEPKVDAHVERCEGRISKVALISKEDLK